jgi:hypothetical protein
MLIYSLLPAAAVVVVRAGAAARVAALPLPAKQFLHPQYIPLQ